MKKMAIFQCETCGYEYPEEWMAAMCENGKQLSPCPVSPGDSVLVYERYDDPQPDKVVSVRVDNYLGYAVATWKGRSEADFWENLGAAPYPRQTHEWLVTVENRHQMSKDDDSYTDTVSLSNIWKDGVNMGEATYTYIDASGKLRIKDEDETRP